MEEVLFNHIVQKSLNDAKLKTQAPSMYLYVQCSDEQIREFGPGAKDLRNCSIVRYSHDNGTTVKFDTRKLDNLGYVNSYGGVQNDPERLRRLNKN
jgi:hypothetical protein